MNPFRLLAFLVLGAPAFPMFGSAVDNAALPERLFPGLDQILREAMSQSPGIVLRNLDLEIAKGDELQAKAGLYPTIGGSLTYEESRESREGIANTYNAEILNYSFGITQPIWRWRTVSNNAKIGEIRRLMAERQYQEGYRMFAQQIRGGYIDLVVRRAAADQAKFNQKLADDALRLAQDRLAKGAASGGEVFQIDMTAQQARLAADRTEEDLRQALVSFRRLTGQTAFDAGQIPDDFPVVHGGEDVPALLLADFLSQKEPQNTDTFVMRQQLESESLNLEVQRKRLYPMFSLVAGVFQTRQNYSITAGSPLYRVTDRYVGISANWSIFDGLATHGAIVASQARKRQLDVRYRQLTDNLAEDAQRQAKLSDLALRQMRISDRLYEDRGYYLQSREQDFKQGTASETDLNAARAAYVQARIVSFSARAAYLQQLGEFLGFIMEDPIVRQAKAGRP
jgi:outer membrane protein TolC